MSHLGLASQGMTKPLTQEGALLLTVWATWAMGGRGPFAWSSLIPLRLLWSLPLALWPTGGWV